MWISKTEQFEQDEMDLLETHSIPNLVQAFIGSDPVVVLRALAEILLNGDEAKLIRAKIDEISGAE